MKLEHYPVKKLKKEVRQIFERHLDLSQYRVFFFGSRVTGDSFERSDIDIGVEGPLSVPVVKKFAIQDELERIPMLYKIDLVDFKSAGKNFVEVAKQKIELIND